MDNKILVTVPEAAEMTGFSQAFLWPRVTGGEIPSVKAGRSRRILVTDLRAWAEGLREPSAAGATN